MKSPTVVLAQHPPLSTTAGIASQHWIQGGICLQDKQDFFTKSHWLMYVIHDNDNNVCIYLASWGLSIFSLNHDHVSTSPIYIFFIQIYIFSLWMLMGLFEGWSYSSAGMMGRKKHDTITIKRFFAYVFTFEWILHKYCKLTSCIPESIAGAMKVSHLWSSKHIVKLLDTHQKWWDPWS